MLSILLIIIVKMGTSVIHCFQPLRQYHQLPQRSHRSYWALGMGWPYDTRIQTWFTLGLWKGCVSVWQIKPHDLWWVSGWAGFLSNYAGAEIKRDKKKVDRADLLNHWHVTQSQCSWRKSFVKGVVCSRFFYISFKMFYLTRTNDKCKSNVSKHSKTQKCFNNTETNIADFMQSIHHLACFHNDSIEE